jgi:cell division septation protein DedD
MMRAMHDLARSTHQQIWITKAHVAALGVTTLALASLAFFVGMEVGRGGEGGGEGSARVQLLPDATSDAELEALLLEVEAAQRTEELAFQEVLTAPKPPPPPSFVPDAPVDPATTPAAVAEPPADPEPTPGGAARPLEGWVVQVASYHTEGEADARVAQLEAAGIDAYRVAAMVQGRTWHRVRVGGYPTKEAANEGRLDLAGRLGTDDLQVAVAP